MKVSNIEFGSKFYHDSTLLRNQVLRVPLGMDLFKENLSKEESDHHFAAFIEGNLIGCLILTPLSDEEIKMRQVAVAENMQSKGIGKALVTFAEQWALRNDFKILILHARKTAVSFYLHQHYHQVGEEFLEVGIPHFKMQKFLKAK